MAKESGQLKNNKNLAQRTALQDRSRCHLHAFKEDHEDVNQACLQSSDSSNNQY